jgi:hypothetical protein
MRIRPANATVVFIASGRFSSLPCTVLNFTLRQDRQSRLSRSLPNGAKPTLDVTARREIWEVIYKTGQYCASSLVQPSEAFLDVFVAPVLAVTRGSGEGIVTDGCVGRPQRTKMLDDCCHRRGPFGLIDQSTLQAPVLGKYSSQTFNHLCLRPAMIRRLSQPLLGPSKLLHRYYGRKGGKLSP